MRLIFFISGGLSLALSAAAVSEVVAPSKSFNLPVVCEQQVLDTLSQLETPLHWQDLEVAFAQRGKLFIRTTETESPLVTLTLVTGEGQSEIQKWIQGATPERITYRFKKKQQCAAEVVTFHADPETKQPSIIFSDKDLSDLVKKSRAEKSKVLIYTWSPNMVYSIRGVQEIEKVARKKNLQLIVLADPNTTSTQVAKVQTQKAWPQSYSRQVEARGILAQKALLHFPTLLVLNSGEFAGPVRPGYEDIGRLEKFLDKVNSQ